MTAAASVLLSQLYFIFEVSVFNPEWWIKQKVKCLLLPTVPFNSYRGKEGNMLIPTRSHKGSLWGKSQLPFPLLCWRGVKGAGLCWAPAPAMPSRWAKPGSGLPWQKQHKAHGPESEPCPGHQDTAVTSCLCCWPCSQPALRAAYFRAGCAAGVWTWLIPQLCLSGTGDWKMG